MRLSIFQPITRLMPETVYFATVEPFKLHIKPLQSTWWVSVDERNLFDWVRNAPSSERAWIYQERHLYVLFLYMDQGRSSIASPEL